MTIRYRMMGRRAVVMLCVFIMVFSSGVGLIVRHAGQAWATTTYTVYFYRNYSNPGALYKSRTTTDASTRIEDLCNFALPAGTLALYGTTDTCHYVHYLTKGGHYRYHAFGVQRNGYPAGSVGDDNCINAWSTIADVRKACGITGTKIFCYLYYKQVSHSFKTRTAASCMDEGTSICSTCDHIVKTPALGHDYHPVVTKEPTCIEEGVRTYICSRCSASYTESIPATGISMIPRAGAVVVSGATYLLHADGTAIYRGPSSESRTIISIPDSIRVNGVDYRVTGIAFKSCFRMRHLVKVHIGRYVVKIGAYAFAGCPRLKKVSISSRKLLTLGKNTFKGCRRLSSFFCGSARVTDKMLKSARIL